MSYILKYTLDGKQRQTLYATRKRADALTCWLVIRGIRVVNTPVPVQTKPCPEQFRLS